MDSGSADVSNSQPVTTSNVARSTEVVSAPVQSTEEVPSKLSTSGISSWAKNLKIPQPFTGSQDEQLSENASKSTFARFTGGLGMRLSPKSPTDEHPDGTSTSPTTFIGTFTKGLVDSSKNAVKAVQVKARQVVSQNKRRYQVSFLFLLMLQVFSSQFLLLFHTRRSSTAFNTSIPLFASLRTTKNHCGLYS